MLSTCLPATACLLTGHHALTALLPLLLLLLPPLPRPTAGCRAPGGQAVWGAGWAAVCHPAPAVPARADCAV
jgi:hypothetical protein